MSVYARLNNTATRLIANYGRSFTFTRVTQGAYDPITGTAPETSSTFTANAVKDEFSSFERNDSSIQVDDIKLIAESSGSIDFKVDDLVEIEGLDYRLLRVNPIKPGASVVAYELQARK